VWVNTKNFATSRLTEKLDDKWQGPYKVTKVYPRVVVVALLEYSQIFLVFHILLIKRY
jgi:hypothetical protein